MGLILNAVMMLGMVGCSTEDIGRVGQLTYAANSELEDIGRVGQLTDAANRELLAKGMRTDAPIFMRIFKNEAELEVWKDIGGGTYALFKTFPICAWSGNLGPKQREGDRQAPEGFYVVAPAQLNPRSKFYLSFNLGYPNAYDRSYGRTGSALMVHGDCSSRGCYAMTNPQIEEIYALAVEAFRGGQGQFNVHAFPFRMHEINMTKHSSHRWIDYWRNLKQGYDLFESSYRVPSVSVLNRRYEFTLGDR
jgi:murein L,D-transpeptidase YafK